VRDFVKLAFAHGGIDDWESRVTQDARYFRPAEVDILVGDAAKAPTTLGWAPRVDFPALVGMMVDHDLAEQRETLPFGVF
jgi:GDPmannose 4,6-dehydratase